MKAAARIMVIVISVWTTGCLSFKVVPSPAPEDIAFEIMTCKKIDPSGELYRPVETTSQFRAADKEVICFVRLRNIRKAVRLKWKWYGPDQRLFRESKEVLINANEDILETISAFDRLTIPAKDKSEGQWIVTVFMDRELIARTAFSVRRQDR
jgi:hypothetical protein